MSQGFFFFVIFTIQSWLCLKMDSRWHLELSRAVSNSEKQIRRNLRILEFQDLGPLDSATHRHGELPDGPGLGPALPHSAIPDSPARSLRPAESALLAHCASAVPAPPNALPRLYPLSNGSELLLVLQNATGRW